MREKKIRYFTSIHLLFLFYFILMTTIYFLSIKQGNQGINLKVFGGGDDGQFYWRQTLNVADGLPWIQTSLYPWITGQLVKLTGIKNVYLIRMFNYIGFILLVSISLKFINYQYEYISERDNNKINSKELLLVTYFFYMSLLLQTSLSIYRDVWIYLFYMLSTYYLLKYKNNKTKKNMMRLFLYLIFLWNFRKYALLSFVFSEIIFIFYKKNNKNFKRTIIILSLALLITYTFFLDFSIAGYSLRRALTYRFDSINIFLGGSQMRINLNQSSFLMFLFNYLHSFLGNLLGPLPWHIKNTSMLLIFIIETLPMIYIVSILWKQRKKLLGVQINILVHAFTWIGIIGITNDNIGTASRLRPIAWLLILIVFSVVNLNKGDEVNEKNTIY